MSLFGGFVFLVVGNFEHMLLPDITLALVSNGVKKEDILYEKWRSEDELDRISHVVCDEPREQFTELKRRLVPIVTTSWLLSSTARGKLVPTNPYSSDPNHLLKDVFLCCASIPEHDKAFIHETIVILGGQYSEQLTKSTTHLVTLDMAHEKCSIAQHFNDANPVEEVTGEPQRIKIVLPEWLEKTLLLKAVQNEDDFEPTRVASSTKTASKTASRTAATGKALKSYKIYFNDDFQFSARLMKSIAELVQSQSGKIVQNVKESTHFITRFRSGERYKIALKKMASSQKPVIGNILLFLNLVLEHDLSHRNLLTYPLSSGTLSSMESFVLCQTNYTGEARAYIQQLAILLGAKITKTLKPTNTHLIASKAVGKKYDAAKSWGLKIVSHQWLEEQYVFRENFGKSESDFPCNTDKNTVPGIGAFDITAEVLLNDLAMTVSDSESENLLVSGAANANEQTSEQQIEKGLEKELGHEPLPQVQIGESTGVSAEAIKHEHSPPSTAIFDDDKENTGLGARPKTLHEKRSSTQKAEKASTKKAKQNIQPENGKPYNIVTVITGHDALSKADLKKLATVGIKVLDKPQDDQNCIIAPSILRTEKFLMSVSKGLTYMLHTQFLTDVLGTLDVAPRLSDFKKLKPAVTDYPLSKYIDFTNEKVKQLFGDTEVGPEDINNLLENYTRRKTSGDLLFTGFHFNLSANLTGGIKVVGGILESFGATYSEFTDEVKLGKNRTLLLCNENDSNLITAFEKKSRKHSQIVEWNWVIRCIFTGAASD
ncbi:unnamed protein product [Kuraishia capsulata CBS 1993]|uniref:BRCT domain-containing protein n=1 Tax=Kuraishia capsulata CBS 1993 TaxID=1382522 RepID=W6MM18_9ASCO|nr:uncharacterized protein KUCA_T00003524001 [Kuraishia capsulata CBS 1993]CDK27546.1 unnamed protein product [Kuraishia capsulata CBS 1993]